jgi:RNA polymerase sigma-70 factor (ECF subfamily)
LQFSIEASLLRRARTSPEALDELIASVWPEVYRVALGIVHERSAAEDAAQDACAAIARSLSALKDDGAFYGWMYRIAGRSAVATARSMMRHSTGILRDVPSYEDPDTALDLRDAISALPLPQRSAVVLHYYAGLSSFEIAAALQTPAPTVRFHLMLARKTLRRLLRSADASVKEACTGVR